jgi:hypothetical protein
MVVSEGNGSKYHSKRKHRVKETDLLDEDDEKA